MHKTINELLESDVYGEEFLTAFTALLTKFTAEFDDMAQMQAIRQAQELLKTINEQ